ncbi:MerR family DNA-binding transcriptional regulator [Nocardia sp. NPDC050717]|uniref:MerR family DNA-binding transcriptional regulator n=1 Tax=Nocardia sp. NPDC050717 TaxID=3157221 RepID=UPI003403EF27
MGDLSISELRERTGLASSALRFYERKGLLRASGRVAGKRCYEELDQCPEHHRVLRAHADNLATAAQRASPATGPALRDRD